MSAFSFAHLLDPRKQVRFDSALELNEAIRRLSSIVRTSSLGSLFKQHIRGTVSEAKVRLERVTPFFHNSWRPTFAGNFVQENGKVSLVGSYGLSASVRRFMYVFIVFGVVWSLGAGYSVVTEPQPELPFWFPFAGVGMSCVGILMTRGFALTSSGDVDWLSQQIRNALGDAG